MRNFFTSLFLLFSISYTAQLVDVINEVVYTDDGTVAGYPTGYSTYRIFARFQDSNDFLNSVYALNAPAEHICTIGDCGIWNHPFGGVAGSDIEEVYFGIFPDLAYDSYITIGSGNGGEVYYIGNPLFPTASLNATGGSEIDNGFILSDGAWFIDTSNPDGYPTGPDNRVLVAQISCPTGMLSYALNLHLLDNGNPNTPLYYCHNLQDPPASVGGIPEIDGTTQGLVLLVGSNQNGTCAYEGACNYAPDGSCSSNDCEWPGCGMIEACNYNPEAFCFDDAICTLDLGCQIPTACNYNPDGNCSLSCLYPGCADPEALNYDPDAGCEGDCIYFQCKSLSACNYNPESTTNTDCVWPGCQDPIACNYNPNAGCEGTCYYGLLQVLTFKDENLNGVKDPDELTAPFVPLLSYSNMNTFFTNGAGAYYAYTSSDNQLFSFDYNGSQEWMQTTVEGPFEIVVSECSNILYIPVIFVEENPALGTAFHSGHLHCTFGGTVSYIIRNLGAQTLSGYIEVEFEPALQLTTGTINNPNVTATSNTAVMNNVTVLGCSSVQPTFYFNPLGVEYTGAEFSFHMHIVMYDEFGNVVIDTEVDFNRTVQCPFDPNYIEVFEEGWRDEHFILSETELQYVIHFQNTGNAPAQHVRLENQLSSHLDWQSLSPESSSHEIDEFSFDQNGLLSVFFNDVFLPDSTSDLEGSQGSVSFRVKTLSELPMHSFIESTASIFFDENPPVITNTVFNTIFDCDSLLSENLISDVCTGELYEIDFGQEYGELYYWEFQDQAFEGAPEESFLLNGVTLHTIFVTISNPYCTAQSIAEIYSQPYPSLFFDEIDSELIITNGLVQEWYLDGEVLEGETTNSFSPSFSGCYSALATNQWGCSAITEEYCYDGIEDLATFDTRIFPNPANTILQIETESGNKILNVRFYDILGRVVKDFRISNGSHFTALDIEDLNSGNYTIEITSTKGVRKESLIIQ